MVDTELLSLVRAAATPDGRRRAVREVLDARGVPAGPVLDRARDGILLVVGGDGPSRIGGPPLLPAGAGWPYSGEGNPMSFVAALDLAQLGAAAPSPVSGTLLVYWDFDLVDLDFVDATRVFHVEGAPVGVEVVPDGVHTQGPMPLAGVWMPLPGRVEDLTDDQYETVEDLWSAPHHQLLGRSFDVQGPVLDEIAYWFGEARPETRERYTAEERTGEGWVLLGQIDSTAELMYGDAGTLYLVLPAADLAAARFDRVMGIMQCS